MDKSVRVPEEVLVQAVADGESVILDMKTEHYFGLNEVGASIWSAVTAGPTVRAAVDQLLMRYDVERSVLLRDVADLLDRLLQMGLLEFADS